MIKLLLFYLLLLPLIVFCQQQKEVKYIHPPVAEGTTGAKNIQGSGKLLYCRVLRLKCKNGETKYLAVFSEITVTNSVNRAKMRNDYLLKREKAYLEKIFFAKAHIVEEHNRVVDMPAFTQKLRERYTELRLWGIINGDVVLRGHNR
jgi:hypothetical protein